MKKYSSRPIAGKSVASPYAAAIGSIVAAVFLLSLSDSLVKLFSDRFTLGQLIFLRSLLATVFIGSFAIVVGDVRALQVKNRRWVYLRSMLLVSMWMLYYAALPSMSFSLAAAEYYTSPFWMAVIARIFLGNKIPVAHWIAILLGFCGVLFILNPSSTDFSFVLLLPLLAAICYAGAAVMTWRKCSDETPLSLSLNLNVCLVLGGLFTMCGIEFFNLEQDGSFVLGVWRELELYSIVIIAGLAALLAVITTLVSNAYRLAPSSQIGVFDNSYLVFGVVWSVVLFSDVPDQIESLGIVLILMSAILVCTPNATADREK